MLTQNEKINEVIEGCHALIPIWTKDCYKRCMTDEKDAVRREVERSLNKQKKTKGKFKIVPLLDWSGWDESCYQDRKAIAGRIVGKSFDGKLDPRRYEPLPSNFVGFVMIEQSEGKPNREAAILPDTMAPVLKCKGTSYVHEYPEVWIRKLHRLLQGW